MYQYKLYLGEEEIAGFHKIQHLYEYAFSIVRSLDNNYNWESLKAVEVQKKFLKAEERKMTWDEVSHIVYGVPFKNEENEIA